MPSEGIERKLYLSTKFGSKKNAQSIYNKIEDEGKLNNIYFQFDNIKKTPNTFLSHKLLAYAHTKQKQSEVLESLFYQYFIEGNDIGDLTILLEIAKATNIFDNNIEKYIISTQHNQNLLNEEKQARMMGVNSVPCFIFNKEYVLSGAQPKESFIKMAKSINNNV